MDTRRSVGVGMVARRRRGHVPGRRSSPRGFTLIELLVVIAIIALLVSILIPSLKQARELAEGAACAGSQRVLFYGFATYAHEYNGAYPWFFNIIDSQEHYNSTGGTAVYNGYTWAFFIWPYVEDLQSYECPGYEGTDKPVFGTFNGKGFLANAQYKANAYLGRPAGHTGPSEWKFSREYGGYIQWWYDESTVSGYWYKWFPAVAQKIVNPAEKVLLYDNTLSWAPYGPTPGRGQYNWTGAAGDGDRTNSLNYTAWYAKPHIAYDHGRRTSFLFIDGNISLLEPEDRHSYGTTDVETNDERYWMLYQ